MLDERIFLDIVSAQVANAWKLAEPVIAILRTKRDASVFENFEYLAVRSKQFSLKYPEGTYPAGLPRMSELRRRDRIE